MRPLILLLFIKIVLAASSNEEDHEHQHLNSIAEKSVKLELEKWISKFDEKLSSLQKELQNEKNANAELKRKLGNIEEDVGKIKSELKRDCEWGPWSDWELCNSGQLTSGLTQSCDAGNQQRKRTVLTTPLFGEQCAGTEFDTRITPTFKNCVDDWCYQEGTSQQFTKCERASSDGKTCYHPEIRYGSTVGGRPAKFSSYPKDVDEIFQWCKQLFSTPTHGNATYSNSSSLNVGKGALIWGSHFDENNYHWMDIQDGYWKDSTLDYEFSYCNKQTLDRCIMTSVTCQ